MHPLQNEIDLLESILAKHNEQVNKKMAKINQNSREDIIFISSTSYVDLFGALTEALGAIRKMSEVFDSKERGLFVKSAVSLLNAHTDEINNTMEEKGMQYDSFDTNSEEYKLITMEFYEMLFHTFEDVIELAYDFD